MPNIKFPTYKVFKDELFENISSDEKNTLFYWSLIDSSGWEEVPDYFPDVTKGNKKVVKILEKSPTIKQLVKNDGDNLKKFIQSEFLSNYLLGAELELKLGNSWVLDTGSLQKFKKPEFPDLTFRKNKLKVNLEIKGALSASDLKDRVMDEVVRPYLRSDNYDHFLLLLLFPICPKEMPARVSQLIKGYYVYEEIIRKESGLLYFLQTVFPNRNFVKDKKRQVYCQCFVENKKEREELYTLEHLAERIYENYFKELSLLN